MAFESPAEALEKLRALGSTAEQVAQSLFIGGICGKPRSRSCCPIACFLGEGALVERRVAWVHSVSTSDSAWMVSLPHAVRDFIDEFDDGGFPMLVEE